MMINQPELLAPAGNLEKLKMAVLYGADAVYLSGQAYGLRASANNFTLEEMSEGLAFARAKGARVYVTVNILAHNAEIDTIPDYLKNLEELGVDGIIVSDPGIIRIAQSVAPNLAIHLSTQANTTNWSSAKFWEEQGIKRIVLARELSLEEIKVIKAKTNVQLETFVHGAMCISYSGRCLLSNYLAQRDANRGFCAHPCRWKYHLMEETRPGEYYPVIEDETGTFIFNSKDLCLLEFLPELIEAGVSSFKIEGRMKSVHYVATIIRVYRQAIDSYLNNPDNYVVKEEWLEEIAKVSHRDYTTGFFHHKPGPEEQNYSTSSYKRSHDFVGIVQAYDFSRKMATVEVRNRIKAGETLEFVGPKTKVFTEKIDSLKNEEEQEIDVAPHPHQIVKIKTTYPLEVGDMLRRKIEDKKEPLG